MQEKPHAVCVPFPAQGHINPMMMLAKLLHSGGFHVTFALTHYNHARLLRSRGPHALDGLPSFRFASFPDGLPPSDDPDVTQDLYALSHSLSHNCVGPFTDLLNGLNAAAAEEGGGPRISCIVSDVTMPFTLEAAEAVGIKAVMFWPASASSLLGFQQYPRLLQEGFIPLKDDTYLKNGYLDTPIDWIPAMKGIRLKDLLTSLRTTDPNGIILHSVLSMLEKSRKASAIILNTCKELEQDVVASLAPDFPPLYPVGPLHIIVDSIQDQETMDSIGSNLWKEDERCIEWLDSKEPASVMYVNFGSITVMTGDQLAEFAFGLANSTKQFLWVIRPGLVNGESAVLPREFLEETKERCLLVDWCDQQRVLSHPAIGGFLTHNGWNSTLESVCAGVPMISWPFFWDQQMNCWWSRNVWGIGMEIETDVKRDVVERQVRELMDGERGKEMKMRAMEWKLIAHKTIAKGSGESSMNLHKLINHVMASPN